MTHMRHTHTLSTVMYTKIQGKRGRVTTDIDELFDIAWTRKPMNGNSHDLMIHDQAHFFARPESKIQIDMCIFSSQFARLTKNSARYCLSGVKWWESFFQVELQSLLTKSAFKFYFHSWKIWLTPGWPLTDAMTQSFQTQSSVSGCHKLISPFRFFCTEQRHTLGLVLISRTRANCVGTRRAKFFVFTFFRHNLRQNEICDISCTVYSCRDDLSQSQSWRSQQGLMGWQMVVFASVLGLLKAFVSLAFTSTCCPHIPPSPTTYSNIHILMKKGSFGSLRILCCFLLVVQSGKFVLCHDSTNMNEN